MAGKGRQWIQLTHINIFYRNSRFTVYQPNVQMEFMFSTINDYGMRNTLNTGNIMTRSQWKSQVNETIMGNDYCEWTGTCYMYWRSENEIKLLE